MSAKCLVSALILLLFISAEGLPQAIEVSDPMQLTNSVGQTYNQYPSPVWNGTEWVVAFLRIYGEETIHILRCTEDGYFIGGQQLIGEVVNRYFYAPRLNSYENGWALTCIESPSVDSTDDSSAYMLLLNKNAKKTNIQANLFSHKPGSALRPIPVGPMFVVFYCTRTNEGSFGIYMAYIDRNGKRVVPDRLVKTTPGQFIYLISITPTSQGFALMGMSRPASAERYTTAIFMLVGLDGKLITDLTKLDNNGTGIWIKDAIWNGTSLAVSATENWNLDDDNYVPISRMLSLSGTWKGGATSHKETGAIIHHGLGFNGDSYVAVVSNIQNGTSWCQKLSSELLPSGKYTTIDDSKTVYAPSMTVSAGSMTGFFAVQFKLLGGNTMNLHYIRMDFPHSGKPAVKYFNGKVHEFNGKSYALLDWLAAGTQKIQMKTKGGRWTLPSTGFHAAEVTGKSKFKILATNNSGSSKAKVKITP